LTASAAKFVPLTVLKPEVAMEIPQIDVGELSRLRTDGAVIIDVRNPDEYEEAHVPGALLFPLPELAGLVEDLPADVALYLICKSGGRSQVACEQLAPLGHEVANVAGGTMAWINAGSDVATGRAPG
jgi:rhodanese-related sulfurtransferase